MRLHERSSRLEIYRTTREWTGPIGGQGKGFAKRKQAAKQRGYELKNAEPYL